MYEIVYFSDDVLDAIRKWPVKIRVNYFRITSLMEEQGPNIGLPHTKAFGKGLFEIRAKGAEGIGRAFFCAIEGKRIVILHAFVKKGTKTPKQDLDLAIKRLNEVKNG